MLCVSGENLQTNQPCTFGLDDIPVPSDAILLGDVRKDPSCQATSFDQYKPNGYPNYSGLRMVSREEAILAEDKGRRFGSTFHDMLFTNNFGFGEYNTPILKKFNIKNYQAYMAYQYIQIPKTSSSSIKETAMFVNRNIMKTKLDVIGNISITTIRHPISRYVSSMNQMLSFYSEWCDETEIVKMWAYEKKTLNRLSDEEKANMKASCLALDATFFTFPLNGSLHIFDPRRYHFTDEIFKKGIEYMYAWSIYGTFHFPIPSFWTHLASQMYFYNIEPIPSRLPKDLYKTLYGDELRIETTKGAMEERRSLRRRAKRGERGDATLSSLSHRSLRYVNPSRLHTDVENYAVLSKEEMKELFRIDAAIRVEHRDQGFDILREEVLPHLKDAIPNHTPILNTHKSNQNNLILSCDTAWQLYEFFKQDFVCLGYEMPVECLKRECMPSLDGE